MAVHLTERIPLQPLPPVFLYPQHGGSHLCVHAVSLGYVLRSVGPGTMALNVLRLSYALSKSFPKRLHR